MKKLIILLLAFTLPSCKIETQREKTKELTENCEKDPTNSYCTPYFLKEIRDILKSSSQAS